MLVRIIVSCETGEGLIAMYETDKTTIRLTRQDRILLEKLGQVLAYKLGKAKTASQSDVIRYSIRRLAELELSQAEIKESEEA